MYVGMWALRNFSDREVQYPIRLRGSIHISVNVLRRVAAKLAVHSAMNVIILNSLTYTNRWCWLLHNAIFFMIEFKCSSEATPVNERSQCWSRAK